MKQLPAVHRILIATIASIIICGTDLSAGQLRVATYNIRNCIGSDDITDIARTAAVIDRIGADIVAIQEVDSVTRRSNGLHIAAELAKATGMLETFVPAIDFDGGKYGVAILSREKPVAVHRLPLPGREEQRVALIAEFTGFIICCTHLSLTHDDRITAARLLIDTLPIDGDNRPIILAGDLNAEPDDPVIGILSDILTPVSPIDSPTWPADNPVQTIDYIFVSANRTPTTVTQADVINEPLASDHRPIAVDLHIEN